MRRKTQILIVDTDGIMRDGLVALLGNEEECAVVGAASNGADTLRMAESHRPDLVIIDLSMLTAGGPDTIVQVKKTLPDVRVLVLTFHKEDHMIDAALRAGADGYILKSDTHMEFITAIRTLADGKGYITPAIYDRVVNGYVNTQGATPIRRTSPGALSQRERQVVRMIAEGYRTREIAQQLSLSHKTVEKHRTNLMRKLGLKTAPAVAAYAIAHGYLD